MQSALLLPVLRLADYLDTDVGPSDEEGGKEAKRQKSEPTTPISTSSRTPNEYDEVVGTTQVDSREGWEAERFEERNEPEFQDIEEELPKVPGDKLDSGHVSVTSHGGYGSSSLKDSLKYLTRPRIMPLLPATLGNERRFVQPAAGYEPKCGRRTDPRPRTSP